MRFILVDHVRARHAAKRGSGDATLTLAETAVVSANHALDVLQLDEALKRLAMVDERKAKVIEMRYFGGLTQDEIACASALSLATVKRDLRMGEAWLRRYLES